MQRSLEQYFQEFMYESEFVKKVRPATLLGYKNTYATFTKLTPDLSLERITTSTMIAFFKLLQERKRVVGRGIIKSGIKKSTAAAYWCKLNVFFEWLVIKGYMDANPFKQMKYPAPSYEDKKFLQKKDIEKILAAIHKNEIGDILLFKRNIVLFYLLLFCGLRKEEVLLLQLRDIDFERKMLTIRGETSKAGKSRQVPLHSTTLMHLKDYLKERKHYTTPYVIVSISRDDKLSPDGLIHLVSRIKRVSGIRFHLHQFRHTFAINFLRASNNVFKLQQLLGHQDIKVTMLYLRCLPTDELRSDIELMNIDSFI